MLQDQAPEVVWQLHFHPATSLSSRLYALFLLVVCVITIIKLVRIWRHAWPFRLARQAKNPAYLGLLQATSSSVTQWTLCTFLAWGILMTISLSDDCVRLSNQRVIGTWIILDIIQDYAGILTATLSIVLFLFLIRWHL